MIWWHRLLGHKVARIELADVGMALLPASRMTSCDCGRMWLR